VRTSPAVANDVVYVGSDDKNVYALNATTGALLWSYATGNLVESSQPSKRDSLRRLAGRERIRALAPRSTPRAIERNG
jgi:glucose dehydrogenase